MPVVTLKFNKFPKKSISLPCRSHPTTFQIEEALNKIKSSSSTTTRSADNICSDLSHLVDLYKLVNHLLVLPGTQNLIFSHSKATWVVQDIMNGSLKLLDICNNLRDLVLQMQEHFQDLQCVLRRSRTNDHIETCVAQYNSFRKKTKKDAKEFIMGLKQTEKVVDYLVADLDNHHLVTVIRVLMEVTEVTISIFESLLMYLSSAPVLQTSGWPLVVSKLMHNKGSGSACRVVENEIEGIDVLLLNIVRNGGGNKRPAESMQIAQVRLEGMQNKMQGIESGLACMFRKLVKTRASLLNIMSLKILSCSRLIH